MKFAFYLAKILNPIILSIIYIVCFQPIGIIYKIIEKNNLKTKIDKNSKTYWEKPDFYFISNKQNNKTQEANNANFVFKKEELQGFKDILNKLSIEIENQLQYGSKCSFKLISAELA